MRHIRSAVLYTALALGANAALAGPVPEALLTGDMKKLNMATAPQALPEVPLIDETEAPRSLAEYRGQYVLLNFWATWCAPCRKEMPALDALQADLGGERFQVVTVATGRNPLPAIDKFFAEAGLTHLPKLRDPQQALARASGVMGLPVTLILDPEGQEIGRLVGDADWNGAEARAVIAALLAD